MILCKVLGGVPGGSVKKNLLAKAGDLLIQEDPNAAEQLSLCATSTEPVL